MPTSQNSVTDRVSRPLSQEQLDSRIAGGTPTDTAKQNYTAIRYGNDHGNAANSFKIVTPQLGEITANGLLKIYSSVIRGVTDACAVKDSKNGNKAQQQKETN